METVADILRDADARIERMREYERRLKAPFPPHRVKWRCGAKSKDGSKCLALAYVDARDVMDRLDEVFGPFGWDVEFQRVDGGVLCTIIIREGADCDAFCGKKSDGAEYAPSDRKGAPDPFKTACSEAFKRAAVHFGIGRYLYDLEGVWVQCDQFGNILPQEIQRLQAQLIKPEEIAERMLSELEAVRSIDALNELWRRNAAFTKTFENTPLYGRLVAAFRAKREHLEGTEERNDECV